MDALTPAPLIHFYDTRLHAIPCGVKGSGHRSTKYVRGVSCPACIGKTDGEHPRDETGEGEGHRGEPH